MPPLPTAAEVAVRNAEIQRELTDEELLAEFISGFPRIPDMDRQIHTQWGPLSAREAVQREKREFLNARRQAIAEAKQRQEAAAKAAAEAERQQQEFEAAALRGAYLAALRDVLKTYNQAVSARCLLETALQNAQAELDRLKGEDTLDAVKLAKTLGIARDLIDALQTKLLLAGEELARAQEILRLALDAARREFVFLHSRKRQELIAQARGQIETIFDHTALGRSRYRIFEPELLAACAQSVVGLDKNTGFFGYRYHWPEAGSAEALLKAIDELEARWAHTRLLDQEMR
jgi:hypothetical protein